MNFLKLRIFKDSAIFIVLISIDQFSKYLIRSKGGFYVCNPHIAWGILINNYLFFTFWAVLILILLVALKNKYFAQSALCLIFILSGAVSNMTDRIFYGCVVDFIDLKFWPVFNLADIFIVWGAIFLLVKRRKV